MRLGLERQGAHVVHEDRHAFLGHGGAEGVHGFEGRVELHQSVEILGRAGDTRVLGRFFQGRRRNGVRGLPLEERPGHRVEPEEYGEQAGACPWQPDDDPGPLDAALAHLGMFLRPVLEGDAIRQRTRQHLGDEEASERRQLGFVLAGTEIDLQRLPIGVAPEVVRTGQLDGGGGH